MMSGVSEPGSSLTIAEVAAALGLSKGVVRQFVERGQLPTEPTGRVRADELTAFITGCRLASTVDAPDSGPPHWSMPVKKPAARTRRPRKPPVTPPSPPSAPLMVSRPSLTADLLLDRYVKKKQTTTQISE